MFKAMCATQAKGPLKSIEFDPGRLRPNQVQIKVRYCGLCHSDLSMLNNDWGITQFPFVPGHEVVGTLEEVGGQVKHLKVGQTVGLGWFSQSCMTCRQCMTGHHNLCATAEQTIVGRHGGFADRVRCSAEWALPLPERLDVSKVGPMFCGGITVFNPIVQFGVLPTHRVGVVGIGGLGHMALQFLSKWGCDVIAFTSSDSKRDEAIKLGATSVVNSRNPDDMKKLAGSLDFLLVTANVDLDWNAYIDTIAPKGRLHFVGVVPNPVPVPVFNMILAQRSLSGSPLGSPATTAQMLEFAARHHIAPVTENYKMTQANDALEHLHAGKARYRIVLENDLG
ncbi:MAG: alcohol dehydrogenase catalytic domain-containing protein [Phycisphaera sp.]|nr:alcohol dehydrogenase catalytic domain-containing protein [Phycisphaera sp.]